MMYSEMDTEEARKKFWKVLRTALEEKGDPFYFTEKKGWAIVNRDNAYSYHEPCIAMDFLWRRGFLRINAYIENNIPLYDLFKSNKDIIESQLGFRCLWKENTPYTNGRKKFNGNNTRRIETDLYLDSYPTFKELAEQAIPIVEKFIKVFRGFIKC